MERIGGRPDGYLSVSEAMIALGVSRGTIYTWMGNGVLPYVWLGLRRYVAQSTIDNFARPGAPSDRQQAIKRGDKKGDESYNPQIAPRSAAA